MKQTVLKRKSCSGVNRLVSARLKSTDGHLWLSSTSPPVAVLIYNYIYYVLYVLCYALLIELWATSYGFTIPFLFFKLVVFSPNWHRRHLKPLIRLSSLTYQFPLETQEAFKNSLSDLQSLNLSSCRSDAEFIPGCVCMLWHHCWVWLQVQTEQTSQVINSIKLVFIHEYLLQRPVLLKT